MARLSSANSRSPCFTVAPSRKCTSVISLSMRVLTATLAIGVTVPRSSMRSGTLFFSAFATSIGTTRGAFFWFGACATAPLNGQRSVTVLHDRVLQDTVLQDGVLNGQKDLVTAP